MSFELQRIINPEEGRVRERVSMLAADFQCFLTEEFRRIVARVDRFKAETRKMAEQNQEICEKQRQRIERLTQEKQSYKQELNQLKDQLFQMQRKMRELDTGQRMARQRQSQSLHSSASSTHNFNQPTFTSALTNNLSSLFQQDQPQILKTFIETDSSSNRNSIEEITNEVQSIDELIFQEFKGHRIKHKKRSYQLKRKNQGIVLKKIDHDQTWSVFSLFSLKEQGFSKVVKFNVLKLHEQKSIVFGVGLRSEVQHHNNISRQHVLAFNPYSGGFRGYNIQLKTHHRVDRSKTTDFQVRVRFDHQKVLWQQGGHVIYERELRREMLEGDLVVFVALYHKNSQVLLCI